MKDYDKILESKKKVVFTRDEFVKMLEENKNKKKVIIWWDDIGR